MATPETVREPRSTRCTSTAPSRVAVCDATQDVVDALASARDDGLEVAIRGGGHSIAGLSSTDGGLLIDLAA